MKETGILMPVFSLPSKHGVGDLGAQAREWINLLSKNGIKIWQILPLNPVGYGNSPYQPYSSLAGDELYISLETLFDQGLLRTEPEGFMERTERVVYDKARAYKEPFLREAFASFSENEDYKAFISQPWVKHYGVFRAFKSANKNRCWNEWPDWQKNWPKDPQSLPPQLEAQARYHIPAIYFLYPVAGA